VIVIFSSDAINRVATIISIVDTIIFTNELQIINIFQGRNNYMLRPFFLNTSDGVIITGGLLGRCIQLRPFTLNTFDCVTITGGL
jgi:hypothetical protein